MVTVAVMLWVGVLLLLLPATVSASPSAVESEVEVVRTGPMQAHVDAPRTGETVGHTVLVYLESRATTPPDVLVIENVEYAIEAGLEITIPVGVSHAIVSSDNVRTRRRIDGWLRRTTA